LANRHASRRYHLISSLHFILFYLKRSNSASLLPDRCHSFGQSALQEYCLEGILYFICNISGCPCVRQRRFGATVVRKPHLMTVGKGRNAGRRQSGSLDPADWQIADHALHLPCLSTVLPICACPRSACKCDSIARVAVRAGLCGMTYPLHPAAPFQSECAANSDA
jgi:hypothetical protein